jgi:hypothetical protein
MLASLYDSASLVQVVGADDQAGIRSQVDQIDVYPGIGYAAADAPELARSVLDVQDQDLAFAVHLKSSFFEGTASSGFVLHQEVKDPLTLAGKST